MVKTSLRIARLQTIQTAPASVGSKRDRFANVLHEVLQTGVSDEQPTSEIRNQKNSQALSEGIKADYIGLLQEFTEDLYFV